MKDQPITSGQAVGAATPDGECLSSRPGKPCPLVFIRPVINGRPAMSAECARQILSRKDVKLIPDWVTIEARAVVSQRVTWWNP